MSNFPVKVKVEDEAAVVKSSSLGTLLSSYGDISSSSEDELEGPKDNGGVGVALRIVKTEEVDLDLNDDLSDSRMMEEVPVPVNIKHEPGDGGGRDDDDQSCSLTDFATIRVKNEGDEGGGPAGAGGMCELSVEDFLEGSSYVAAREIKVEVESGTDDSEADSADSEKELEDSEEDEPGEGGRGGSQSNGAKKWAEGPKVKGELTLYDLPPIEDLHISVPHEECKPIGVVKSVVEPLVIVEAYLETPALNLDSVLFLEEGDRALGHVFDVIGPVKQPMYCVRFNSKEHIQKNKVEVGMLVYCAPKTPYTSYVFLAQLKRLKGSDASWMNDHEPPPEEVEYSDDEMERIIRKNKKKNRRARTMQPTAEDAVPGEDEQSSQGGGNRFRGRKRHFNNQNPGHQQSSSGNGEAPNNSAAPFVPALVPGFIPMNFPNPWQSGPMYQNTSRPGNHRQHHSHRGHHRFGGGGGGRFQRFGPPVHNYPPPPSSSQFQEYPSPGMFPYQSNPWRCPPFQYQQQQPPPPPPAPHFNFNGYNNPYQAPRAPPPPPPPPPPGEPN